MTIRTARIKPAFSAIDETAADDVADLCSFETKDIISAYTRAEAVRDGVVVDLRDPESFGRAFPDVNHTPSLQLVGQTFGADDQAAVPVALTTSVAAVINMAINHPTHGNDIVGVLHDVFWMAFLGQFITFARAAVHRNGLERPFTVIITGSGRVRNHRWIAALDGDGVTFKNPEDR